MIERIQDVRKHSLNSAARPLNTINYAINLQKKLFISERNISINQN